MGVRVAAGLQRSSCQIWSLISTGNDENAPKADGGAMVRKEDGGGCGVVELLWVLAKRTRLFVAGAKTLNGVLSG